jgi:thymidylate kinase
MPAANPCHVLITFSGLDGAGKSTLIEWLRRTLEAENHRVAVFHMNDHVGVYAYLRLTRDALRRLRGARPVPASVPKPPVDALRSAPLIRRVRYALVWNKQLRRWIYPFDLLVFLAYRLYLEKAKKQILIMDRYFYDTLVDVSDGRHWRWVRLLEKLTPTPQVPIYLDITPEESYARKGEYSVEYLKRRRTAYRTVFPWVESGVTLVSCDIDASKAELRAIIQDRLGAA